MTGSKTNTMSREQILAAVRAIPTSEDYVWDGVDEDDRPATQEELLAVMAVMAAKRGRPIGTDKTQITLRVDNEVLEAFKANGKGWQTKMNEALKQWLAEHAA